MTCEAQSRLLVTSGDGPRECRRAVALVLRQMEKEAGINDVSIEVTLPDRSTAGDPASALVSLTGADAERLVRRWIGTVQWTCQSPFRPHHKRRNWFVGIFSVQGQVDSETLLDPKDLKVETFRSGGPGGQHQNTTDSGVRITHGATGLSAVSTDERSQHRNRQVALERLRSRLLLQEHDRQAREISERNLMHKRLERGNPVRVFRGIKFMEVTT
jgi:peptide chain release factor